MKETHEKTFAGLVLELEQAVSPLGFSVCDASCRKGSPLFRAAGAQEAADGGELIVTIAREWNAG